MGLGHYLRREGGGSQAPLAPNPQIPVGRTSGNLFSRMTGSINFLSWRIALGLTLIASSAILYLLNYLIFRDTNYMFRLFLAQLGFLPISVLLVTIIINQLLSQHAKRSKLAKLNMVIGAFFSDVGTRLLGLIAQFDMGLPDFRKEIMSLDHWSDQDFFGFSPRLVNYDFQLDLKGGNLELLRDFLVEKRDFLLRLLENPHLLEHDSFSNLLLAVFHLTEELAQRPDLHRLTAPDRDHLASDLRRAYLLLIAEWTAFMKHLRDNYPYLFSLALRTNPFDPQASAEIR